MPAELPSTEQIFTETNRLVPLNLFIDHEEKTFRQEPPDLGDLNKLDKETRNSTGEFWNLITSTSFVFKLVTSTVYMTSGRAVSAGQKKRLTNEKT